MSHYLQLLTFILLLFYSIEIIPNWNLDSAAVKLLSSSGSINYLVVDRYMYSMHVKLKKTITKEGDTITQKNYLSIGSGDAFEVDFENIESFYNLNGINIICPKGKYHPFNADTKQHFQPDNFEEEGDWDLKCYKHNTNYFLVFYLMNGGKHLFFSPSQDTSRAFSWKAVDFTNQLFDLTLENGNVYEDGDNWKTYNMGGLVLEENYIQLKSFMAEFHNHEQPDDLVYVFDSKTANPLSINLIEAKKYYQAYFKNYSNDFYFYTYNNISDFISGYSTVSTEDYSNIGSVKYHINNNTPFEFLEEAEIKEIDFLLYNKYLYYTINNTKTGETYHGLYDVKLDKIMFNTNESINTFIPYSGNSLLAISNNNVYKICPIKNGEDCLEQCDTGQVIRDSDGNKCGTNCDNDKYLLIPDNICLTECDSRIYITNSNKQCGLCRDMDSSKPYKLIGSNECLENIPSTAKEYNNKLYLLICKSGYILYENNCVPHCYPTCETCSDYSQNSEDQKCLTCNESYYLEDEKCIKIIPTTIPTTIPTKIPTTIPTTLPITFPTTIITTIPTTIITTIPKTSPIVECLEEKCLTCSHESNKYHLCLSCNSNYTKVNYTSVFPEFLDCMKKEDPKLKSFYFNESSKEFRPCYKNCEKCLIGGNNEENNCLECKKGFMFRPGDNSKNNCVVYSKYYYISPYGQYKPLEVLQCPEEAKFVIKEKNSCIDDCKKDKEYKYLYNGNCMKECPEGMFIDNYICKENKEQCNIVENDIHLKKEEDFTVIKTLAKSYLDEFKYTKKHISLYTNNDFYIILYKNKSCLDEVSLSMPRIDFKECYDKVKKEYNINEDLLISIVDQKGTEGNPPSFHFFHPLSGEELNYEEICKEESIVIKENLTSILNNENNTNLALQLSLIEQGIDIFDLNSPFYKDLCFDFNNNEKRDIPLSMRIQKVFPNVKQCQPGCKANGIQLPEKNALCDCSLNDLANSALIKDNIFLEETIGKALDLIISSNIMVVTCYKYIFKYFYRSIGGYITFILILGNIICTIFYFLIGLPKLKIYILSLTENYLSFLKKNKINKDNFPPNRRSLKNEIVANKMNKNNKKVKINPSNIKDEEKVNKKKNISKRFITNTEDIMKKEKVKPLLTMTKSKITNSNDIIISLKDKKNIIENKSKLALLDETKPGIKKESQENIINNNKIDIKNKKQFFEEYFATYPDDMEYDDAIIKDKRPFKECFIENLKEKQIIAFTFFADDPTKIRIMKIILLILNINLYFVITGLFYSENFIAEIYQINEEKENFFSYIPRSVDILIKTTLVSIIIGYIVELFFVEEKKIKGIFRREKDNIFIMKEEIIKFMKYIEKMNLAFIIVVFFILIISSYYLLCFNYVYPKTQVEWIKCSITIMIIMHIISFLKCLVITCLRYLSFYFNSPKIYKVSKLID